MKLYLVCHFRGNFDVNLKRGHNDTNSSRNDNLIKDAYSVTMNIFRKKIFSFQIICKSRIKLCCHNKSNFNN